MARRPKLLRFLWSEAAARLTRKKHIAKKSANEQRTAAAVAGASLRSPGVEQHIHAKWSTMHVNNGYWSEEVAYSSSEEEEEERRGRRIANRAVVGISALRRGGGRGGALPGAQATNRGTL